jgi:hypothetical protein
MSKRKPARTIKARSASKIRSKAAGSGQPKGRANCAGAGTAVRTERRRHRHRHALHRLATAHGVRLAAVVRSGHAYSPRKNFPPGLQPERGS